MEKDKLTLQLFSNKRIHVDRSDLVKEFDILVRVELGHLALGGGFGSLSPPKYQIGFVERSISTTLT